MERKTIIWSATIVVIFAIAIWLGALAWLNNPINNAFGPEPSTYCEQDSDCVRKVTSCPDSRCGGIPVHKSYNGPVCPFPDFIKYSDDCIIQPRIACIENQCQNIDSGN
jgi:hypothetical protein